MIKIILLFLFINLSSLIIYSQEINAEDTLQGLTLQEVVLKAYEQNRRLIDIPGAVNYINHAKFSRFNNTSVLSALNATAGVRMEERSPGSYRLNIRGSSLRAPFGVRNVKIYYNDIPFTDPGGNTYLNQLGFYNFGSVEILKGPGSSLYGAGTGGVMLIESNNFSKHKGLTLSYSTGSYGLHNSNVNLNTGNDTFRNIINYQHQSADGYRDQSELRRDIFSWETMARLNEKDKITGTFFYGNLYYKTPGALTRQEYESNARAARPGAGINPGAKEAGAAIFQKMFLAGITYHKGLSEHWQNTSTLYGAFTKLDNPAIRNYARNNQPHFGGRTIFQFKKTTANTELIWHTGGEVQQGFTMAKIYSNKGGIPDTLQTDDEININSYFIFSQLTYSFKSWIMTGGLSFNRSKLEFTRFSNSPATLYALHFKNEFAPRLAVLKKLNNRLSIYASWSKGFSPPTSEEVFPTGSLSNPDLAAEQGVNYELGAKGYALKSRLSFDVSAFYFQVKNSIVQRRDAAGGDYYTNAGNTRQKGIESQLSFRLLHNNIAKRSANFWLSHTFYDFHYKDFKQVENDFSGNRLPGAAKHNFSAGLDWRFAIGLYTNIVYQYNDPVPLNDANTSYAEPYNLLGSRIGYKHAFNKITVDLFTGIDNLFDVRYSLGNDINAFGGRFYNAAPGRNYFAGAIFGFNY